MVLGAGDLGGGAIGKHAENEEEAVEGGEDVEGVHGGCF